MHYDQNDNHRPETKKVKSSAGMGPGLTALVLIVVLAIGAYFLLNGRGDNPSLVAASAMEGAKEVPQAGSDAVTPGDQPTTRPNADGSADKLDQK